MCSEETPFLHNGEKLGVFQTHTKLIPIPETQDTKLLREYGSTQGLNTNDTDEYVSRVSGTDELMLDPPTILDSNTLEQPQSDHNLNNCGLTQEHTKPVPCDDIRSAQYQTDMYLNKPRLHKSVIPIPVQ
jgi:hypothetical protein